QDRIFGSSRTRLSRSGTKQAVDVIADDVVALARLFSQSRAVENLDAAVMRADQPGRAQPADHLGDRRSLYAEHLAEKLLRERNDVALDLVAGLQQPPRDPRGDVVQTVAGRRLLHLGHDYFRVSVDHRPDSRPACG